MANVENVVVVDGVTINYVESYLSSEVIMDRRDTDEMTAYDCIDLKIEYPESADATETAITDILKGDHSYFSNNVCQKITETIKAHYDAIPCAKEFYIAIRSKTDVRIVAMFKR